MDVENVLGSLLRGALSGKKKKSHRSRHAVMGGSLINAKTLLAAAGVAWGLYESATRKNDPQQAQPAVRPFAPGATPPVPPPPPPPPVPGVPEDLLRLVRLTISAARADGTLAEEERTAILAHAREAGLEAVAQAEIDSPRPLAQIVAGAGPDMAPDLYKLAFTIVRADEGVSGAERIYLAQLAHLLGLDAAAAARLEGEAAARIDQAEGS